MYYYNYQYYNNMADDFIDFSDSDDESKTIHNKNLKTRYLDEKSTAPVIYDDTTMELYRVLRERKLNVLNQEKSIDPSTMFPFEYQWDPYTGERRNIKDPYGALYFHPDDLIHWFYYIRLTMLWVKKKDEGNGFYIQAHYDDAVGSGERISVIGRGDYPECYVFRLPINDCYLPKDADYSIITMGPKLLDSEIELIEKLANEYHKDNYKKTYKKNRPSLVLMKKLYDQAISRDPDISEFTKDSIKNISLEKLKEYREKANKKAVDILVKMC